MTACAVKICGITDTGAALAAARAGASFLGFVFYKASPRSLPPAHLAEIVPALEKAASREGFPVPARAGVFVDAGKKEIAEAVPFLTHIQCHGRETPERLYTLGNTFGRRIIKAVPVAGKQDIRQAAAFEEAADFLLFDARPPAGADRPGGHGIPFDWSALEACKRRKPYFLAGGLHAGNVGDAVAARKADSAFYGVDVSGGVESAPGVKSVPKIREFIKNTQCRYLP